MTFVRRFRHSFIWTLTYSEYSNYSMLPNRTVQPKTTVTICSYQYCLAQPRPSPAKPSWGLSCTKFGLLLFVVVRHVFAETLLQPILSQLLAKPGQSWTNKARPDHSRPDQTSPDHTRPDQTKPVQARPNQSKPDKFCSHQQPHIFWALGMDRPDLTRPGQTRPDQIRPDQTIPDQTSLYQTWHSHIRPGQAKPDRVR